MSPSRTFYERLRPLVIWLGLGELAWIGSWLLTPPGLPAGYLVAVAVWIVAMLAWMALAIFAVGTIVKYVQGDLPRHFVIFGSMSASSIDPPLYGSR